jgi:hypothetical protein
MATNFKITKESAKCSEPKHYVMEREYKAEGSQSRRFRKRTEGA